MTQKAHDELARSVIQLLLCSLLRAPPCAVVRAVDDSTPTASVSLSGSRVTLTVNPDFYLKTLRKGAERVAVLKHEALHLLFRHLFRGRPREARPAGVQPRRGHRGQSVHRVAVEAPR